MNKYLDITNIFGRLQRARETRERRRQKEECLTNIRAFQFNQEIREILRTQDTKNIYLKHK